jgi:hypothetical protein
MSHTCDWPHDPSTEPPLAPVKAASPARGLVLPSPGGCRLALYALNLNAEIGSV